MEKSMTELRSVTCHMGSHSVTCHPTQVSAPRLNPSHAGRYSIYLPRRDGRLSWPCYSETQPPGVELATSRSRIQRPNHWATKQHDGLAESFADRKVKILRRFDRVWRIRFHWRLRIDAPWVMCLYKWETTRKRKPGFVLMSACLSACGC